MRQPVDIYYAEWKNSTLAQNARGDLIGYFMFIDGGFRWDSLIRMMKAFRAPAAAKVEEEPYGAAADSVPPTGVMKVCNGSNAPACAAPPRLIEAPKAQYSEEGREAQVQGAVVLQVVVGTDGRPQRIKVVRSLGYGLDEQAIQAMREWKFEPGTHNGVPVPVVVNVLVDFQL